MIARLLTDETDTAFQLWFLAGYAANFAAALYVARRLGLSLPGAGTAALIFAFALPTSAHMSHVQLHYRFGIPLSALYLLLFLQERRVSRLATSALWLAWQFYCGIYMGFFASLLLGCIAGSFLLAGIAWDRPSLRSFPADVSKYWDGAARREKALALLGFGFSLVALVVLIFPYVRVSRLYDVSRTWADIEPMLPRWRSYLMADLSSLWGPLSQLLPDVPMRHEHQMFPGVLPAALSIAGLVVAARERLRFGLLLAGGLGLMMILTLDIAGHSLWFLLYRLPLASAIRAMARIDQVLLFPIGYLAGVAIDRLWCGRNTARAAAAALIALIVAESALVGMPRSAKAEWRARQEAIETLYPRDVPASSIVFIAQKGEPAAHEIDVMWAAMRHRNLTLNGYSGLMPRGFSYRYGTGCDELIRRVVSYQHFAKPSEPGATYRAVMDRIVPVGFVNCEPDQLKTAHDFTVSPREYTADEFRQLSYGVARIEHSDKRTVVSLTLRNDGDVPISAASGVGKPVRISWRFLGPDGSPLSGWETRQDLPFDIPAKGELVVRSLSTGSRDCRRHAPVQPGSGRQVLGP